GMHDAWGFGGVGQACGHDMHMACVTGAVLALNDLKARLPGRIRFFYQHAEEVAPGGAMDMVQAGCMEGVNHVLGLHCDPTLEVGHVGIRVGGFTAAADSFDLVIRGTGGHSARPHEGVDTMFVTTLIINALYQAASRLFDARSPIVIAIGSIHGGQTYNVLPEQIALKGTVRSLDPNHRVELRELFHRIATNTCQTYGATYELRFKHGAAAVINDAHVTEVIAGIARELLGDDAVHTIPLPSMGAEDFSEFLQSAPGSMFRLGTLTPGEEPYFLHSPRFNPDERAIAIGARILSRAALHLLHEGAPQGGTR
ncbi:MAG: amidohydrolase, partial [Myxococcota bacterium]